MTSAFTRIDASSLHVRLKGRAEIALLDVREEGVFGQQHILLASNAPLSRLERIVPLLVPRRGTPIVLVDDDEGLATRAARVMAEAGYADIAILAGGVAAWGAAGFELFTGVYVPSKAFGEFVEVAYGTPHIDADDFKARRDAGEDIVLFDSRPFDEYSWITIPGAINCPSGELVLRAAALIPSDRTLVVVNCGGRTRSIIGAQALIDAGLSNRVTSLKNGTQGWHLAGLTIERGANTVAPLPADDAHNWAREAAQELAERFSIPIIDAETLLRFEEESADVTLYRFDVRDPAEYRSAHRAGFHSAPGGQLVQATDTFIAVRQGRIVLADTDGVRARVAAAWLYRMGFDQVFVLDEAAPVTAWERGDPDHAVIGLKGREPETITPLHLAELLKRSEAVVVDLGSTRHYREGHIPGAWFAIRARFADDVARLPPSGLYVLTSPDEAIAPLAALELQSLTGATVKVLAGGTAAWVAAGYPLETTEEHLASLPEDVLLKAFERRDSREGAMRDYLQWELDLVEQVRRDGTLEFRL